VAFKTEQGETVKSLIDIIELSRRLSIAKGTLYNWVSQGRVPFKKIGRCVRFDWDEIEKTLLSRSTIDAAGTRSKGH
jgi:excisionase family DNA binding protein